MTNPGRTDVSKACTKCGGRMYLADIRKAEQKKQEEVHTFNCEKCAAQNSFAFPKLPRLYRSAKDLS